MSRDWGEGNGLPREMWEKTVELAINGKRGQKALRELEAALLALPERKLCNGELVAGKWPEEDDEFQRVVAQPPTYCALGSLLHHRQPDVDPQQWVRDPDDEDLDTSAEFVADALDLRFSLAWTIAYENDHGGPWGETEEQRWERMLRWVRAHIRPAVSA